MRSIFLSLIISIAALNSSAKDKYYFFERISPESGLAFDAVYSIAEDCNGLLWIGCNNGLYHYNTHEIEKILLYPDNSSIPQAAKVNKIIKDEQCRMWICTNLGLYLLLPNENEFTQIPFSPKALNVSTQSVENILQIGADTFLVVINNSLFELNLQTGLFKEVNNNGLPIRDKVSFIGKGINEEILIGTMRGQVIKAYKGRLQDYTWFYGNSGVDVRSICVYGDNYLVGFDGLGVKVIDAFGNLTQTYNNEKQGNYHLPSNRVRQIIHKSNGHIWIGTYGGILVISPGNRQIITVDGINGLPYNSIYTLYQGNNDGVWVGTWAGGIAYYNEFNYRFKHIKKTWDIKTGDRSVASTFAEDKNQNILIGSEDGGLAVYNPTLQSFDYEISDEILNKLSRIKTISTNDGTNFFIGTFDMGFWHFNKNTYDFKRIDLDTSESETIYSSSTQIENDLWIGTRGAQMLFKYNLASSKTSYYDLSSLLPDYPLANWVWKTYSDSKNNLWVCTDNGIFKKPYGNTEFIPLFKNDTLYGLESNIIYTISEDVNGKYSG